jgi:hypothetical protein
MMAFVCLWLPQLADLLLTLVEATSGIPILGPMSILYTTFPGSHRISRPGGMTQASGAQMTLSSLENTYRHIQRRIR